ncbi:MAG: hypothetical protein M4579_003848 [Chaenotheca gracillima]|nr:MAG: hypothetical protein M4579_003848 [Chaenotheca gracillima]
MNISQPVASSIGSVDFEFLSTEEIKALSVRKIQNPTTFDTLLNPVPGGLYDPALGAWGDHQCKTCNLRSHYCPGHAGHVELPVPVYHPTFMEQVLLLLRAKCNYCHHFKISRVENNLFVCKLKLVHHGLLSELEQIDEMHLSRKGSADTPDPSDSDESDEMEDLANLISRRNTFVKRAIRAAARSTRGSSRIQVKTEAMVEARRTIMKSFFVALGRSKKCSNCNGISPSYRKDRFVKIFERALSRRDYAQMVQGGFKLTNAMIVLNKQRNASQKSKPPKDVDEGIVADLDDEMDLDEEEEELPGSPADELAEEEAADELRGKDPQSETRNQRFINAGEVHAALSLVFEKEQEVLSLVYNSRTNRRDTSPLTPDRFFIRALLVPPNTYRPEVNQGDGVVVEFPQNSLYKQILNQCESINQIHKELTGVASEESGTVVRDRPRNLDDLQESWIRLQDAVNSLLDRDRSPMQRLGQRVEDGIKQKLEKKEGLFRKNMMGKRVNFAARSVISPDPNIETNEIGVPPVFAKKLTYPEPVTTHNFFDLKEAVKNGPEKWPGAAAIENEMGQVMSLKSKTLEERQALANQLLAPSSTGLTGARNKKVHRHLNNGDIVLMNRQPTLHKPSMMAHRAKVLPGEKTIRMHYSNCNTYNADFDGDEMNMHFPQNEIARAEALQVADTDHQYLSATAGKPLRGLIQDHISMGLWMTNRDTFFDREEYQQLLYSCLRPENNHTTTNRIETIRPAILKPKPLWTGKQVVTTILKNIKPASHPGLSLGSTSSTNMWDADSEESTVLFKDGELITGTLDKKQLGPTAGGLVHSIYETYGHTIAGKLLSVMGRLLTKFLNMRAFSCGMEDLILTEKGEVDRLEKLAGVRQIGLEVASKYIGLEDRQPTHDDPTLLARLEAVIRDDDQQSGLDMVMNASTQALSSAVTQACLPAGLAKPFPKNQMQAMTNSGAKGTVVNANLISCNLGQQVLEGRRVPTMISGKTLPCFKPFDTDPRAGGFVTDRFLTGVRPQEYFFHSMAGREGLIDTAVKTSRSGYLQRCLIKGMEGLKVQYDDTIRDSDGSLVQFLYGEDGLDVTKQTHLRDFKFIAENFFSLFEQLNVREEFQHIATDDAMEWNKTAMRKVKKTGQIDAMDPVLAHFSPSRFPYSTSEAFTAALKDYQDNNPDLLLRDRKKDITGVVSKKSFEMVLNLKYLKSTVEPGEAVGIVAGQSIGEPSTQMTLNTFHLAGHSTKNVTLGIPRLREIVMTASANISTPMMTLYMNPELQDADGERFAKAISRLSMAEIIDRVTVNEKIAKGTAYARAKIYQFKLDFFPAAEYREEYAIDIPEVARTLETRFVPLLQKTMRAELKKKDLERSNAVVTDAVPQVGESAGIIPDATSHPEAEMDGGDDEDEDDDATNAKQRANRAEAISYEAPDEGEEEIREQGRRETTPEDMEDEGIGGSPRPNGVNASDEEDDEAEGKVSKQGRQNAKQRRIRIMERCEDVTGFEFDEDGGQYCTVTLEFAADTAKVLTLPLVESACRASIIQSVPGLGNCTLTKVKRPGGKEEDTVIETTGVNLSAMQQHTEVIDPHRISTNDIAAFLRHYGVEACRASIVREMSAVFGSHAISVDARHLSLIADMMTRGGGFAPFNRSALRSNASPLLKMSFETTVGFLKEALLEADSDLLDTPSARIVMGKLGTVGTGAFDVMMPVK